ncbi:ATP-binding cassette domain-containing protein [Vibrio sp. SCSIO 43140]|uniref:ABC transporter ATP-binding protein n=1 Tax=Vibrio sp. SCSIO 43140 TaxID=2819100 RepID=UPI00207620C8|nr:ATP-binding cassette domain-containing protein [Vibrio sp. SCSIO 43140]USD63287.1 ATP-binding cassette domain-containing protein [Vibrio sp. SCSIO 43140]
MFSLKQASFHIGSLEILSPFDLEFVPGQVTALLGHNGSGKSSLIKLLSRQNQVSSGSVLLDERPLDSYVAKEYAKKVAYLPQHPPITDGVTVRELVMFGRYPWKGVLGRYTQEDHELVGEAIDRVGLTVFTERFVSTLSGGERQRAWVAMLLAQKSECILLDEPTSALDVAHQYELLKLIRELNQSLNLTVIMVIHDVNMAARFSDRLVALKGGEIIVDGTPERVMNEASLSEIYGMPLSTFTDPSTQHVISYVR